MIKLLNKWGLISSFFLVLVVALLFSILFNKQSKTTLTIPPLGIAGSGQSISQITIDSNAKNEVNQSSINIYKVKDPQVNIKSVEDQAKKLGINEKAVDDGVGIGIKASNGDKFIVDKETGSVTYTTLKFETQTTALQNILSDEEYRKLAESFLVKYNLMKSTAEFYDINRDNVLESGKPFFIEARFKHKPIDGIELSGVGPRLSVLFGENGEIIGFMSEWRDAENVSLKKLPIISIEQAKDGIEKGRGLQLTHGETKNTGSVNEIKIVYNSDPIGYNQKYFTPYYLLKGTSGNGGFTAKIQALNESDYTISDPSI